MSKRKEKAVKLFQEDFNCAQSVFSTFAPELDLDKQIKLKRGQIMSALDAAVNVGLPERGPRGGLIWPPRFFVRRVVWHVLDHAWEIEDRIIQ